MKNFWSDELNSSVHTLVLMDLISDPNEKVSAICVQHFDKIVTKFARIEDFNAQLRDFRNAFYYWFTTHHRYAHTEAYNIQAYHPNEKKVNWLKRLFMYKSQDDFNLLIATVLNPLYEYIWADNLDYSPWYVVSMDAEVLTVKKFHETLAISREHISLEDKIFDIYLNFTTTQLRKFNYQYTHRGLYWWYRIGYHIKAKRQ